MMPLTWGLLSSASIHDTVQGVSLHSQTLSWFLTLTIQKLILYNKRISFVLPDFPLLSGKQSDTILAQLINVDCLLEFAAKGLNGSSQKTKKFNILKDIYKKENTEEEGGKP